MASPAISSSENPLASQKIEEASGLFSNSNIIVPNRKTKIIPSLQTYRTALQTLNGDVRLFSEKLSPDQLKKCQTHILESLNILYPIFGHLHNNRTLKNTDRNEFSLAFTNALTTIDKIDNLLKNSVGSPLATRNWETRLAAFEKQAEDASLAICNYGSTLRTLNCAKALFSEKEILSRGQLHRCKKEILDSIGLLKRTISHLHNIGMLKSTEFLLPLKEAFATVEKINALLGCPQK